MKKILLIVSLFLCTSHDIHSMGKQFLLTNNVGSDADCVSVSLIAAKSVPFLEKVINEHADIFWAPQMMFAGSDKEDLTHLKEYIISYHQMKKTCDLNDKEVEEKIYNYAEKELSTEKLMRLTYNASTNLFPLNVPWGLVNPLVKKMILPGKPLSDELRILWGQMSHVAGDLQEKVSEFSKLNESNRGLLTHPIANDEQQKNVITCLLAPYAQALHQVTDLPSYRKSICNMLYAPVVKYVYVGDTVTASLTGRSLPACPHDNYVLTIHAENSVQQFKLNDKELDFDVKGAFANKDESLFVCSYSSPYEDGKEGVLVIDIATGNSQQIACPGKTVACFNNDEEQLLSFDDNGTIFKLPHGSNEWQLVCNTALSGMKGLLNDPINKMFIYWHGRAIYCVNNDLTKYDGYGCMVEDKNISAFSKRIFLHAGISDVVMDGTGTRLCIKTSQKYFLTDFSETNLPVELNIAVSANSCASFSPDGNVLTISSDKDNVVTHNYFNTMLPMGTESSVSAVMFLQKKSAGQLLAGGKGKVIVQEE